ncbi:MAG TPA: 6,7-dimethyl-8-ribityllumazine synthase [Tepidisphaeraceae bacterium]|nr:6,7-dimethyl-8-ribityllumazine synthase [Tepidisphaeraceae bacterium]
MSTQVPAALQSVKLPPGARIGVAAARFNADLVDELLAGCVRRLAELGVSEKQIELVRVPGAFELPVAARAFAATGRYAAVVCLGAVVRGDTPHFDYVAGECARGLQAVSITSGLPVIFGVLTTNTHQQALERVGGSHGHAGERAAEAAVEMIGVLGAIESGGAGRKTASKSKRPAKRRK